MPPLNLCSTHSTNLPCGRGTDGQGRTWGLRRGGDLDSSSAHCLRFWSQPTFLRACPSAAPCQLFVVPIFFRRIPIRQNDNAGRKPFSFPSLFGFDFEVDVFPILVFSAPARPVDLACLSLTLSAAPFPISLRLVGFYVLDVGLRPHANSHLAQRLHRWRGDSLLPNPTMQGGRCNPYKPRNLKSRVRQDTHRSVGIIPDSGDSIGSK